MNKLLLILCFSLASFAQSATKLDTANQAKQPIGFPAATTSAASANIPSGTAPTTPAVGDIWRDSTGFNMIENASNNGAAEVNSSSATCAASDANTVSYSAKSNAAQVSENGGTCDDIVLRTKTQTLTNKANDCTDTGMWCFLGKSTWSSGAVIGPLTLSSTHKHYHIRLHVTGYAGGGGIASLQVGSTTTIDTGTNYAAGILEGATLTTTSVSVTGIRVGATVITGHRFVECDISVWATAESKLINCWGSSNSSSASTAPTVSNIAGLWANTTSATIGVIQFTAFTAVTGTTTVNFTGGEFEVWGRDDN